MEAQRAADDHLASVRLSTLFCKVLDVSWRRMHCVLAMMPPTAL